MSNVPFYALGRQGPGSDPARRAGPAGACHGRRARDATCGASTASPGPSREANSALVSHQRAVAARPRSDRRGDHRGHDPNPQGRGGRRPTSTRARMPPWKHWPVCGPCWAGRRRPPSPRATRARDRPPPCDRHAPGTSRHAGAAAPSPPSVMGGCRGAADHGDRPRPRGPGRARLKLSDMDLIDSTHSRPRCSRVPGNGVSARPTSSAWHGSGDLAGPSGRGHGQAYPDHARAGDAPAAGPVRA